MNLSDIAKALKFERLVHLVHLDSRNLLMSANVGILPISKQRSPLSLQFRVRGGKRKLDSFAQEDEAEATFLCAGDRYFP